VVQLAETIWGDVLLDQMKEVLSGACCAVSGNWEMAAIPLAKAYNAGCREPLCQRWYAMTLISLHRFAEAARVLEEWIAAEPGHSEAHSLLFAIKHPEQFGDMLATISPAGNRYDDSGDTEIFETKIHIGTLETDEIASDDIQESAIAIKEMISASGTFGQHPEVPQPIESMLKVAGFDIDDIDFDSKHASIVR